MEDPFGIVACGLVTWKKPPRCLLLWFEFECKYES